MARKRLGLLHTSATLVPIFEQLCKAKLPGVAVFNLVDDSLIKDVIAHGRLAAADGPSRRRSTSPRPRTPARTTSWSPARRSEPAVETAATLAVVPVLRVDQPMADRAVATAERIGVIATLPTTLEPTADLIRRRAAAAGREIELTARLCEGAFDALMSGDAATHDAMVAAALKELASQVDVIALAQASMARVVDTLAESDRRTPILASPPLAVDYLATVL